MDYTKYKILIIGDSNVGKTSLLLRHSDNKFTEKTAGTIGIDYRSKTYFRGDKRYDLQIWDTAGQERFRNVTKSYFRDAHGVLVVFDLNDPLSFTSVRAWLEMLYLETGKSKEDLVIILVGNKSDLLCTVSLEDIQTLASDAELSSYIQTSAKEGTRVDEMFESLLDKLVDKGSEIKAAEGCNLVEKKYNAANGKCC